MRIAQPFGPYTFTKAWCPHVEHGPHWPCLYQNRGRKARRRSCRWRCSWMKQPEIRSRMGGRIRDVPWGLSPSQGPWTGRCFLRQAPDDLPRGRAANRQPGGARWAAQQPGPESRVYVCVAFLIRDGSVCVYVWGAWRHCGSESLCMCVCMCMCGQPDVCTSLLLIDKQPAVRLIWNHVKV